MTYVIENARGEGAHIRYLTLENATRAAVCLLQDDPELNTLEVYSEAENGSYAHVKTATHAPDAHWNTEVVVLDPDERIQPPSAFRCNPDESGGYALTDPKHERHHEVMSDIHDNREKV